MIHHILVPLDGSPSSEAALPFVKLLASKLELEVELLRCFEPPADVYALPDLQLSDPQLSQEGLTTSMMSYLQVKQSDLGGLTSLSRVQCGEPASEILSRSESMDMVVMANLGRGAPGRWKLGSVTLRVAGFCLKPVIVVPGPAPSRLETILIGLDGSPCAERALSEGMTLAKSLGARAVLFRALPTGLSARDFESEKAEAIAYVEHLEQGYPDQQIKTVVDADGKELDLVRRAAELDVDLLVLGSQGLRDVARKIMGSVAEDVLHRARCPVMVIH